ncbi:DsbA family oxidoreductase [Leptospira ryugenii]|nr:DsbA family oxidoreductase [Leptospira ryugenii]
MKIDIVSDVVCPWCYVGRQHLEMALSSMASQVQAEIHWRPFELAPNMPLDGLPYKEHLSAKFGSERAVEAAWERLTGLGKKININFQFSKIPKAVNTANLHSLLSLFPGEAKQDEMALRFFKAHFEDAKDLSDIEIVYQITKDLLSSKETLDQIWNEETRIAEIRSEISFYQQNGVQGVPYYIFQNKYALSGAQPPEVFQEVMQTILKEENEILKS